MDRVFHSKISWVFYAVIFLIGAFIFYLLWIKILIFIILAVVLVPFELILIEGIIHNRYTITMDGNLELYLGRFFATEIIPIENIVSLHASHSWETSAAFSFDRIKIVYIKSYKRKVYVSPVKKKEMITLLLKMNDRIIIDENLKKILS